MSQIKQLCIIVGFKKAKKGEIIYFSSSDLPRIFLLKKGNIKIVAVDEDGNETIKDIIQKGDLFFQCSDGILETWNDDDLKALFVAINEPDKILEKLNEPILCYCGKTFTFGHKNRHIKTKFHNDHLELIN
jgi:hypothetical protein